MASTLESEIAGYIRTKSLKSALRYLSFKDQGVKVSVSTITQPDGRVKITFGLSEKENELLQISLQADNSYQARQMTLHFEEQPEIIYRSVLSLLFRRRRIPVGRPMRRICASAMKILSLFVPNTINLKMQKKCKKY